MKNHITFSQALEGYFLHADARRLSPHTIADYTNIFRKFQAFLGDRYALRTTSLARWGGQDNVQPRHSWGIGRLEMSYPANSNGHLPRIRGWASSVKGVKRDTFSKTPRKRRAVSMHSKPQKFW